MAEDKLDAYGHLSYTVGNEDWLACFDAIRIPGDLIAYHVVVNCESGSWIDTIESGTVPATADGIATIAGLPERYLDVCLEGYADTEEYGEIEWEDCATAWPKHLAWLLTQPSPNDDEADAAAEQSLDYFNRYIAGDR